MWLATKFGFYSIVKSSENNSFMVRSRERKDLDNLKRNVLNFKNRKIHFSEITDYKYRIFINKEELAELMLFISENVDYSNFKDKIKSSLDQKDKLPYYSEIWGVMFDYQHRNDKNFMKFHGIIN